MVPRDAAPSRRLRTTLCCAVSFLLGAAYRSGLSEGRALSERLRRRGEAATAVPPSSLNGAMLNHTYLLNDPTIPLSPHVPRAFLERHGKKVDYKIILSDYGWNHPDIHRGLQFPRSLRMRELLQGVVDHYHFDPTVHWSDVVAGRQPLDPEMRYYIFFDVELCFMSNYPRYGTTGDMFKNNADLAGGRAYKPLHENQCFNIINCHYITEALETVHRYPKALLVAPECRGWGPSKGYRAAVPSGQLALVSSSAHRDQLRLDVDQGLPPPNLNAVQLTEAQVAALESCVDVDRRPLLLSFVGSHRPGSPRKDLFQLNNDRDILLLSKVDYRRKWSNLTYHDLLLQSQFAAAPRGDNLFSFRFTEVLSAGAIPVVHSDGWVLPLRPELVDWTASCAVVIPEQDINATEAILRAIPEGERCRRRRACYDIYRRYFMTPAKTIEGIIEGLELKFAKDKTSIA